MDAVMTDVHRMALCNSLIVTFSLTISIDMSRFHCILFAKTLLHPLFGKETSQEKNYNFPLYTQTDKKQGTFVNENLQPLSSHSVLLNKLHAYN